MTFEEEQVLLGYWFDKLAKFWQWAGLIALAAFAFYLRCLRLGDVNHHYLYNPDSYLFHWVADRIMAGQGAPPDGPNAYFTWHGGLAYPLTYIARAVSSLFNLPADESLALASKFLPPTIGAVFLLVIFFTSQKIWNRKVAWFAALSWALMYFAVFVGAAGNIDRDGLSILLLTVGAAVFYLSKGWHFRIGDMDVGWVLAGLVVLAVEVLLYLEWSFAGPALLMAIIAVYFVVRLLQGYLGLLNKEPNPMRRLALSLKKFEQRSLVVIVALNLLALGLYYRQVAGWFDLTWGMLRARLSGEATFAGASEMTGLSFSDIVGYQFFFIPIVVGLYVVWKGRNDAAVFFACWFLSFVILGLFASRVLLYALPATCVLSAMGLNYLWGWRVREGLQTLKRIGIAVLLLALLFFSFLGGLSLNLTYGMSAQSEWQDALAYIKEETPEDAVVMSQWSWGYWILDLGQRKPFVDNGYYGYDSMRLMDVAVAYSTSDPEEAAEILSKNGAGYLVFAERDLELAETILDWKGANEGADTFASDSLVVKALNGEFVSGGGLEVAYKNSEVVIIQLVESG